MIWVRVAIFALLRQCRRLLLLDQEDQHLLRPLPVWADRTRSHLGLHRALVLAPRQCRKWCGTISRLRYISMK